MKDNHPKNNYCRDNSPPSADNFTEKIKKYYEIKGISPSACVITYGCQQNVSDSEKIKGMLDSMGFSFTDKKEKADLILYNTCAVRAGAEERVFGNVGALKALKRQKPDTIIALCGCMVQQEHITKKIKTSFPHVDLVFGTHVIPQFPRLFYNILFDRARVFDITDDGGTITEGIAPKRDGRLKAWLPIMYGCDNYCSYCVVPYVRGPERSRSMQSVLNELKELVDIGYKDITLLGQNVNSYGKGLEGDISFPKLLRAINEIEGDFRVRFMTSHPKDADYELFDVMAESDKLVSHLHLPLQSGNNEILSLMNRGYTVEEYLRKIEYAKSRIPGLAITSDIIVGFPGERYHQFRDTLEVIRQVGFSSLFMFIYSPRTGTKAAEMDDPVPREEKAAWFNELLELQGELSEKYNQTQVGKIARVLLDESSVRNFDRTDNIISGRCDKNLIVKFPMNSEPVEGFVKVKITQAKKQHLIGEQIN